MLSEWMLDPSITYLNHGTVGAPPRRVLARQQELRDEIERQPSAFLLRELSELRFGRFDGRLSRMRAAAKDVGEFLGVDGKDLVFVDNTTSGINAVLRSLDLREGDEVLIPNLAYGAIKNVVNFGTRLRGAQVREVNLPAAITGPDVVVRSIESALTPRTKVVVIDHITSETALVLPVSNIAAVCRARGVITIVDAAHAPGAIPVDIDALGVDFYCGNLHKWGWSPRSSAILWVDSSRQTGLHPTVISWGLNQGMTIEFDWPGTRDPTPHLAAPAGIQFMRELGVEAVQRYNHDLAWSAGNRMAEHWRSPLACPESMIGTMVTVQLPSAGGSTRDDAIRLRDALLFEDKIEVQVHAAHERLHVRVSAQIYNEMSDVDRLIEAVDRRL